MPRTKTLAWMAVIAFVVLIAWDSFGRPNPVRS